MELNIPKLIQKKLNKLRLVVFSKNRDMASVYYNNGNEPININLELSEIDLRRCNGQTDKCAIDWLVKICWACENAGNPTVNIDDEASWIAGKYLSYKDHYDNKRIVGNAIAQYEKELFEKEED